MFVYTDILCHGRL